jgi:glutamyl-tRNA reductase
MDQTLFTIGVSHETAPVAVRERLAYAESELSGALVRLKEQAPSFSEAALLSTCNRVELIGVGADVERAVREGITFFQADRRVDRGFAPLYRLHGRAAAHHLFRVGASLDSMVLGEPQILGQLKLAYAHAVKAGTAGLVLHRAFHKAFSVAKRVRKTTLIGRGPVSISSAVVTLARKILDSLHDKTVMMIGSGKMAEITARCFKQMQIGTLLITSRTFKNAVELADQVSGTAIPFDNFNDYLKTADVVIGSLAVTRPVLGPEEFDGVVRARGSRPVCLIDLGVPRNFDERLNSLEGVYIYDIDDLGGLVAESREEREREARKAEIIVELELDSFIKWLDGLDLVPAIKDIRSSIEQLRCGELKRHRGWLDSLEPAACARIESLTQGLVNKLLHRVVCGLRENCGGRTDPTNAAAIARQLLSGRFNEETGEAIGHQSRRSQSCRLACFSDATILSEERGTKYG